jgi:thymidylate synthase (FAD)
MVYHPSRLTGKDMREDVLTQDIAFNRHSMNDGEHISPLGNANLHVGLDNIVVRIVQDFKDEDLKRTLSRATRATIGVDVNKEEDTRDWEEILRGGLQTALETQVVVFEVSGVSRTCTHQLVRSRRAAFHQQSQRASFMGDRPDMRIPESVWKNDRARVAYKDAIQAAHKAYQIACEEDISYQDARFILPEGTTTYILTEYTLREFLNAYSYRACSMFQHEIVFVFREMGRLLIESHPYLKDYIKITCEQTHGALDREYDPDDPSTHHACRYQGWESVEPQCHFSWARESNRTFKPKHHKIG